VLDDLAAIGPFFAVSSHPQGAAAAAPWRPATELALASSALRDRVASVRAALADRGGRPVAEIEPRVAASAVHLSLAARLIAPALGAAVLGCRLDMRPGGLWWQDVAGGPVPLSVPACGTPPAQAGAPPQAGGLGRELVPGEWGRQLIDEVVVPVTAAIALVVPVSGRVLWGNVASAVNAAAAQVARQRPDLEASAWQAAGELFGSPWLRGEPSSPGPAFRRSSCCLFYRLALSYKQAQGTPSAVCGDCVLAGRRSLR
jgi:hypothetical protein